MLKRIKIPRWLKNKFVVTPIVFFVWMLFFNDVDLWFIWSSHRELQDMKEQVEYFKTENENTREALHDLTTNEKTLEKFAREQYYMKRPNEDLYVIKFEE